MSFQGGPPAPKVYLFIIFLIYAVGTTGLLVAIMVGILSIFAPCQPLPLISILCRDGVFLVCPSYSWVVRMLAAMVEFTLFLNTIINGIHYFLEIMLKGVAFMWIDCKTFVKRYDKKIAEIGEYNNLRIFEKWLNSCIRPRIFLTGAVGAPFTQILVSYIAIKLFQSNENDQLKASLFLLCYYVVLFFTMIIFSGAAQINNLSRDWIDRCKWDFKKKYDRKVQKSLAPLRLEFGNNFVGRLTPLVVQEFCVRQTVSALLVT